MVSIINILHCDSQLIHNCQFGFFIDFFLATLVPMAGTDVERSGC